MSGSRHLPSIGSSATAGKISLISVVFLAVAPVIPAADQPFSSVSLEILIHNSECTNRSLDFIPKTQTNYCWHQQKSGEWTELRPWYFEFLLGVYCSTPSKNSRSHKQIPGRDSSILLAVAKLPALRNCLARWNDKKWREKLKIKYKNTESLITLLCKWIVAMSCRTNTNPRKMCAHDDWQRCQFYFELWQRWAWAFVLTLRRKRMKNFVQMVN